MPQHTQQVRLEKAGAMRTGTSAPLPDRGRETVARARPLAACSPRGDMATVRRKDDRRRPVVGGSRDASRAVLYACSFRSFPTRRGA